MKALWSPYDTLAQLIGTHEVAGKEANPLIMAMLRCDAGWPQNDEEAWCSGAINFIAKLWHLRRTKTLRARDWLDLNILAIPLEEAEQGFDIVILKRGDGEQPGPENTTAPGHVTFFSSWDGGTLFEGLGGNQRDSVCISRFSTEHVLGVRRLAEE